MYTRKFRRWVRMLLITQLAGCVLLSCDPMDLNEPGNIVPETVIDDPRLPSIRINGVDLHLESFGNPENPLLIVLHGGPGSDYRSYISERGVENASRYPEERTLENAGMLRLMDQFQLIFYDRRGSGLSQRFDKNEVSFQDQIDDLFTIIQLLTGENDQVNLLGHSFGGYLATAFINQHPDMVDHVILYEPRPFTQAAFDLLDITSVFEQIGENWIDEQTTVGIHISPDSHEKADYLRTIGASNQAVPEFKEPFDTPYWRLGSRVNIDIEKEVANDGVNIVNNLSGYTGEMLFLYGAKTEAAPDIDAYLNIMISYYPSGQRREIQQAAHLGLYENPEEVSQVVTDFILNQ